MPPGISIARPLQSPRMPSRSPSRTPVRRSRPRTSRQIYFHGGSTTAAEQRTDDPPAAHAGGSSSFARRPFKNPLTRFKEIQLQAAQVEDRPKARGVTPVIVARQGEFRALFWP